MSTTTSKKMTPNEILEQTADWGYRTLPRLHCECPGYSGLLVAVRARPTEAHYDPERLMVCVRDLHGCAREMTLSLKPPFLPSDHVCPGRIDIRDRTQKEVSFFTFGGTIEVVTAPDRTVYALTSPAPIVPLDLPIDAVSDQLALEADITLGRLTAQYGRDRREFSHRLAEVDPFTFYVAVMADLLTQLQESQALRRDHAALYRGLQNERAYLQSTGQWPAVPPTPQELLREAP